MMVALVMAALFLLIGCAQPGTTHKPVTVNATTNNQDADRIVFDAPAGPNCASNYADLVQQGKKLFNTKAACWGCHGRNADGKTNVSQNVAAMKPAPTDLRDAKALHFTTDEERFNIIKNGIPGTAMVPFRGQLYNHEIKLIIEYLEVLKTGGC